MNNKYLTLGRSLSRFLLVFVFFSFVSETYNFKHVSNIYLLNSTYPEPSGTFGVINESEDSSSEELVRIFW